MLVGEGRDPLNSCIPRPRPGSLLHYFASPSRGFPICRMGSAVAPASPGLRTVLTVRAKAWESGQHLLTRWPALLSGVVRARGGTRPRPWSVAASAAGARSVRTGFPPPVSGVPHPSPGACPAASGCHRLPRVPAAGAPVPAPHPDSGGGPFLPGQAAPSVFACGGPGGETEALQSVHGRGTRPSGRRRRSLHPGSQDALVRKGN